MDERGGEKENVEIVIKHKVIDQTMRKKIKIRWANGLKDVLDPQNGHNATVTSLHIIYLCRGGDPPR